jgi:hypothetical protein
MTAFHKLRGNRRNSLLSKQDVGCDIHETKSTCEHRQEESPSCRDEEDDYNQDMVAVTTAPPTRDHMSTEITNLQSLFNTERSLIDDIHHAQSDDSQSFVESEADTFVINNLTCRLLPRDRLKIDEIAIPCSCMDEEIHSGSSAEQTNSVECHGLYSTDSALSRARAILDSAKNLQQMFQRGLCNTLCTSYECVDYEYWTQSSEDPIPTGTSRTEDRNDILLETTSKKSDPLIKLNT